MNIILNTGIHHNENNLNFKLPKHKILTSTMVSVVDFESECPGSSPDSDDSFFSNTRGAKFFNDGLTDNRATYVTADLRI